MALRHWLQLSFTRGIGPILIRRIVDAAGGAEAACGVSVQVLRTIEGIGRAKGDAIHQSMRSARDDADAELARAAAMGVSLLCPDDAAYPVLLRSIPDPPAVLYVRGGLEDRDLHAVAIVGSRRCSMYGREQAERFAALLAGAGATVISGGARGIDSAAHRGALSHPQGRTIAVLGSGVNVMYPPENKGLFSEIAAGRGAVISEYPLGAAPLAENFPRRNRIVSGMSRGVLVVEADERSGALITARQACDDHGRPVFALPGRVDNPLSLGPHQLLRDGATLAARVEDILDHLGPLPHDAVEATVAAATSESPWPLPPPPAGAILFPRPLAPPSLFPTPVPEARDPADDSLTHPQRAIFDALADGPANVDLIAERTSLPVQSVLQDLTFLSLKARVRRIDGQTYARR